MRYAVIILLVITGSFGVSVSARSESPVPGSLCVGVVPASVADFWQKWESADLVLYANPTLSQYSNMGKSIVATTLPPPSSEKFQLRTYQVWKGPVSFPAVEVFTAWGYTVWDCGQPPGYCVYNPENCSLEVETGAPQVFFLELVGDRWETYMAFGTGVYDLEWLETEVVDPVVEGSTNWGTLKAGYR